MATLVNIGTIPLGIKSAKLRDPVTLGDFEAFIKVSADGDGQLIVAGHTGTTSLIQVDRNSGIIVQGNANIHPTPQSAQFGAIGNSDPITCVRIRRIGSALYAAWNGQAEIEAGTNTLADAPVSLDTLLAGTAYPGMTFAAVKCETSPACQLLGLRIEAGELTTAERAAIEAELFGFTL